MESGSFSFQFLGRFVKGKCLIHCKLTHRAPEPFGVAPLPSSTRYCCVPGSVLNTVDIKQTKFLFPRNFPVELFFKNFTYLFLAVLGLRCCVGFSLVVASGGCSVVTASRLPVVVASLVVAHGLRGTGSGVVVHGLSCPMACGIFLNQGLNLCLLH